jgi:uncharacterized protein YecE (DUF72 family)
MGELYIGTSGYDYPEWRGVLYPHELPREEFLSFYSEHFNALELNYTYYGMPDEYQMASMIKRSNGKLHFSVKAHQSLTHTITVSAWRENAALFSNALNPLVNRGLLLSVLLQFPQSFHYDIDERRYLDNLVGELGKKQALPLVVEFRHGSWQNERVFEALRKRDIGWCICDLPALRSLPVLKPVMTAGSSYLRLHGRNGANWHGTNAHDRYEYLYDDNELGGFVPLVDSIRANARLVQIYFNNHAKGHAVVNAQKMKILTDAAKRA